MRRTGSLGGIPKLLHGEHLIPTSQIAKQVCASVLTQPSMPFDDLLQSVLSRLTVVAMLRGEKKDWEEHMGRSGGGMTANNPFVDTTPFRRYEGLPVSVHLDGEVVPLDLPADVLREANISRVRSLVSIPGES